MPSSYSTNLKLEKQATSENNNTWGTRLNDSVIDLLDEAISGVTTIAFGTTAGDCAITNANGALAQGRNAVLVLTGAPVSNVALNVPANNKLYGIRSKHTGANWIKVRPVGAPLGAEVTLDSGTKAIAYSDGSRMYRLTENNATAISTAMLPLVQAATTALGRAALDVPRNATKAEVSAASTGNQSPSTSQLGFAIIHGFKKYTDASGVANTITVTCNPVPASYSEIESLYVRVANTTTSTTPVLNVNALGNKSIKISGPQGLVDPVAGQLIKNTFYEFLYDQAADVFICLNPSLIWDDGYFQGLTLSTTSRLASLTSVLGVSVGFCRNENSGAKVNMSLPSAFTKNLTAWVVGTGNGSLDTGAIAVNQWYHVHLIQRDSDGVCDILTSLSATSPTMPAGYTARRRLGSIRTLNPATIRPFLQTGNFIAWEQPVVDLSTAIGGTTAVTRTLTTPTNVVTLAKILGNIQLTALGTAVYGLLTPLTMGDTTPSSSNANIFGRTGGTEVEYFSWVALDVPTNSSSQIRSRADTAAGTLQIITLGYEDPRGMY